MSTDGNITKKPRVYSVEFWRFAFMIIVALYHLEIFYQKKIMPSGTSTVEFFFVVAGFTIAMSAARRIETGGEMELGSREAHSLALEYVKKKLKAIYPLLAATLVVSLVIMPLAGISFFPINTGNAGAGFLSQFFERIKALISSEWEWLLMVGTPTGFNNASSASTPIVPLWFLTPLIAIGYLYTFLVNRKYNLMMFAAPLIAVLGFTYFTLNSENVLDFYIKMGLFNAGTVRAISEMAMGISLYQLCAYIKKRDWKLPGIIMLQLLELLAIYRYCALTFSAQLSIDNFRRIPYILIIVLLSFANITFLSKLLNRKFMEKLGKISLTMFLIHFPVATAYMWIISTIKRNPAVRSLPEFILRSGGSNSRLQQIPLSLGDLAMYIPFVIAVSVLLNLIVFGIKTARTKRRKRALPV